MPRKRKYFKKKRKFFKKRRFGNRKRYIKANKVRIKSWGIPDRLFTKLRYVTTQTISVVSTQAYTFRGNSVFDPEAAVGGSQPAFFDNWAAMYSKYRVNACKIKVSFIAGNAVPSVATLVPTTEAAPLVGGADANALPAYARTKVLGNINGTSIAYMKHFMSTKKILGLSGISQNEDVSSVVTTNPNDQWYWQILLSAMDGISSLTGTFLRFELTYYVEFYDRVSLNLS